MRTIEFLRLLVLVLTLQPTVSVYNCLSVYNRVPDNSDLRVECGINVIDLEVNLCTVQWAGFDPASLALNGEHNNGLCQGTIDTSVDPSVIRYHLPVNDSQGNPCRQSLQIVNEVPSPSGPFSQFSSIQVVIVTGYINTPSSSVGVVSYATDLFYRFSCRYPMEYIINNTKIVASSVSVATNDKNGSFVDTLSMNVYSDSTFSSPLVVPPSGLQLRQKVHVEVSAVNLTTNFNLLLDHCFATPSPYTLTSSEQHEFFTVCDADSQTVVLNNGDSSKARFSFEAFRFVEHRDQDRSSIFIHCILRLCEPAKCQSILNGCSAVRRKKSTNPGSEGPTTATVSMGPLYTAALTADPTASAYIGGSGESSKSQQNVSGVVVGAIFASAGALLLVLASWFVMKKVY